VSALNDLYVDGEIAGWIGYYEGKICTFMFKQETVDQFLDNTKPCGQVRPVFTTPKIPKPWQGLTDEQLSETYNDLYTQYTRDDVNIADFILIARTIQTKLKELNL
jgi:hypothetical protein